MKNLDDYQKGEEDCKNGVPHREGMSEEYDAGYSFQYMREQNENARSEQCQIQE